MQPKTENEAYAQVLCSHLEHMVYQLRQIPADKWDWTFAPPAPTPRILARHAWQWLQCDRQHIAEPDALLHEPIPDAPAEPGAMCDALAEETARWRELIGGLTPEQLDTPRRQFNGGQMNIRGFIGHMVQNTIYKNGQLSTLFYGLGLDGDAPYDAPFPNPIYDQLRRISALKAERAGEGPESFARSFDGENVPPALLEKAYAVISNNAFGLPLRDSDRLEDVAEWAGDAATRANVLRYLVRESGLALTGDLENPPPMVTVGDLVRFAASVSGPAPITEAP